MKLANRPTDEVRDNDAAMKRACDLAQRLSVANGGRARQSPQQPVPDDERMERRPVYLIVRRLGRSRSTRQLQIHHRRRIRCLGTIGD